VPIFLNKSFHEVSRKKKEVELAPSKKDRPFLARKALQGKKAVAIKGWQKNSYINAK
jgi:hypothetical protein